MKHEPHFGEVIIAFNVIIITVVYSIAGIAKLIFGFTWAQFHTFMGAVIPMVMAIVCVVALAGIAVYSVYSVFFRKS